MSDTKLDDLIKKMLKSNKDDEKPEKKVKTKPKVSASDLISAAGFTDDEGCVIANSKQLVGEGSFESQMNTIYHMAKHHNNLKAALACAAVVEVLIECAEFLTTVDLRAKTDLSKELDIPKMMQRRKRCAELINDIDKIEKRKAEGKEGAHSGALH